ncbi:methylenetetrahydrofolate reductase [NAD(P)H] [Sphingomonas sp. RS2018]
MSAPSIDGGAFRCADVPGDVAVSFEFFPPKTETAEANLWEAVRTLETLAPRFASMTYGAGGTTRDRTLASVARLANETSIPAAAHLTCVEATREEIDAVAEQYWASGVRHIVALRGDPPTAGAKFVSPAGGYANAAALVEGLLKLHPFEISVAAYPECHPDSAHAAADLDNLKRKLDAGATRALTQFFFEPETFLRFRDAAAAAGIRAEIVPGIMPVTNVASVKRMSAMCGTAVPDWLAHLFDGMDEQPGARQLVAATVAAELCRRLYDGGERAFHFYTLNRADISYALCRMLGVRPTAPAQEKAA